MPDAILADLEPQMSTISAEDWRIAIVALPMLSLGELANTIAVLSIGIGAAAPHTGAVPLADSAGRAFASSSNRPVPVLQADEAALKALLLKALPAPHGAVVVPFPRFARQLHVFEDYQAAMPSRDLADEPVDGIGIAGPAKWVRSLTGSLRLMR